MGAMGLLSTYILKKLWVPDTFKVLKFVGALNPMQPHQQTHCVTYIFLLIFVFTLQYNGGISNLLLTF